MLNRVLATREIVGVKTHDNIRRTVESILQALDRSLKQAVETRWNTRLAMLQSVRDALRSGKLHEVLLHRNEYEEVINTLAAITERAGTEESVRVEQDPGPMATEVHNFFASCVQEEEREEDSGDTIKESWGRQLVLKYMNEPTKAGSQSLLNFWQEMSGGLVPVARKLLAIPATSTPVREEFQCCWKTN
ncbi:hypothetical protein SKAU_G00191300 [Synaphobranchus kaupii]|uniref:HAT C-terminal dimerisation domain-containing protein n=1 Tax=Synaphobranchus kaupii TaxID=118154 RepID=A0A9Q1IWW4_SYNKA|nr:hypothetical protein SKAU_G00191300 [Synaphobranchus kaupii]